MLQRPLAVLILLSTFFILAELRAEGLSFDSDGLRMDAGLSGVLKLGFPQIEAKGKAGHKLIEKNPAGRSAGLRYEGDARAELKIQENGDVVVSFTKLPADVTAFRMEMIFDGQGASWKIDSGAATPFPREKPSKPFLFQGNASSFTYIGADTVVAFTAPQYSFQQLQDNREWGWKVFDWYFTAPCHPPEFSCKLHISLSKSQGKPVTLADKFGQAPLAFPGKVTQEDELKEDVKRDAEYFAHFPVQSVDQFSGLPGSKEKYGLTASGFFHAEKKEKRWILADPDGNAFFHLGLCSFAPGEDYTYVKGREKVYEWLPAYEGEFHSAFHPSPYWSHDTVSFYVANLIRKYGKAWELEEWSRRMIERVRKLGFNSAGAFSPLTQAEKELKFPYVAGLPLGASGLGAEIEGLRGIFDPFNEKAAAKMDELFSKALPKNADDPLLIGYFLENEQAFEDIPRVIPSLKGEHAAKQRLAAMLEEKYGSIEKLNQAWNLHAANFAEIKERGLAVSTPAASQDIQAYTEMFLDKYYSLISACFHKYDSHHMLIGNRWQPGTANSEALCRIAGKYMDVISVNYYTYGIDKDYLTRLYKWAGEKPFFLSEFHYSSPGDTGLPGGSKDVASQKERGLAYRNYLEQSAATGFVIGIEWFTLLDQAQTGRWFSKYTGENGNTGLFSVTDRPWKDFADRCAESNLEIYKVAFGERPPFAWDDARFSMTGHATRTVKIPRADGAIKLDGRREHWPGIPPELITGKQMVEGNDAGELQASFRLCHDDTRLHLMVNVIDSTPMKNVQTERTALWNGDAVELFISGERPEQSGTLLPGDRHFVFSAGSPDGKWRCFCNADEKFECEMAVLPSADGKGYTLEISLPYEKLGLKAAAGETLLFDLGIDDGNESGKRVRQLMWNGTERNTAERTHWGRAKMEN